MSDSASATATEPRAPAHDARTTQLLQRRSGVQGQRLHHAELRERGRVRLQAARARTLIEKLQGGTDQAREAKPRTEVKISVNGHYVNISGAKAVSAIRFEEDGGSLLIRTPKGDFDSKLERNKVGQSGKDSFWTKNLKIVVTTGSTPKP